MTDPGHTSTGLVVHTAADFRTEGQSYINQRLAAIGRPSVDFDNDWAISILTDMLAAQLGKAAAGLQGVYDATVPSSATGIHADDLGAATGTPRTPATRSTVTATITGTSGVTVPSGKVAKDTNSARWVLQESTAVGSAGTFRAEEYGATTLASGATLSVVTPVSGWTGATTTADAIPGDDLEADAAYRLRRARSLQSPGSLNANSIRGAVLQLAWVTHCVVVQNQTTGTTTSTGITLPPHSIGVVVYPSSPTDAQKAELVKAIYRKKAPETAMAGTESGTITRADEQSETIKWNYPSTISVTVAVTVVLADGFVLADVQTGVEEAVADYFTLYAEPGGSIYDSEVEVYVINQVAGLRRATATLNGGTEVSPQATQLPTISGTASVSE